MTVGGLRAHIGADIDDALRGIAQVGRAMKTLTTTETVVRVRLDVSAARSQIQPLLQQLRSIQRASFNAEVNLKVKTDLKKARADLLEFKKQGNELRNAIKPIELRINTKGTQKQLQPMIAQLRSIQKASAAVSVKANVTEAMQKLGKVLEILREIKTAAASPINLKIDNTSVRMLRDIHKQLTQLTGSGTNWSAPQRGIRSIGQSARESIPAASKLKEILLAFGAGYLGIQGVQAVLGALKSVFIDFNNTLATTKVGFTTIFSNGGLSIQEAQKKAEGLLQTLKQFAVPTPFELVDLAPLTQQALAFGLLDKNSKNLKTELVSLFSDVGNAAYGLQRGQEGVDRIMLAFGQMKTATRVMGQDMLQLQAVGVNAWKYLAEATGKSTGEVRKLVEKGLIPADGAIKAIRAGMARDFAGGMVASLKTIPGALSSIRDSLKNTFSDAFKSQYQEIESFTVKVAKALNTKAFEDWSRHMVSVLAGVGGALKSLLPIVGIILAAIGANYLRLKIIATAALYQTIKAGLVYAAQTTAIAAITIAQLALASSAWILMASVSVRSAIVSAIASMRTFGVAIAGNMAGVIANLAITGLAFVRFSVISVGRSMAAAAASAARSAIAVAGSMLGIIGPILAVIGVVAALVYSYKNDIGGLKGFTDKVVNGLVDTWKKLTVGIAGVYDWIDQNVFGGEGGFVASSKAAMADVDSAASDLKQHLQNGFNLDTIKGFISGQFKGLMPDMAAINKEIATMQNDALKNTPGAIPGITLGEGKIKDAAAKKAASQALRVLKDQLGDSAKAWDTYAGAVESAADRQIKALKGIQDSLVSVFDSLKQSLISAGIVSDPLQPIIDKLAGVLRLRETAGAIAGAAQSRMDFAHSMSNSARSAQERTSGLDGAVPSKYGGGAVESVSALSAGSNIGDSIAQQAVRNQASGFASGFVHRCQSLARQTVQKVTHEYDRYFAGTAAATMRNFQRAGVGQSYAPGMAVAPGGLLYSGRMAHGVGHVQTVGSNGDRLDQYGRNKFSASNFEWYVPPPGAARSANAALQTRANATGKAQVMVRSMPGAPQVAERKDWGLGEFSNGLSNTRGVPKEWLAQGGAVQDSATTKARFGIQSFLTTKEGGAFWDTLVAKMGSATKAAKFLRVEIANALDVKTNAAQLPLRIDEAGRATAEFVQAKKRELGVLRDSSKWLQTNAYDAKGLALAQEESKVRAEAETDATLKGLPVKQREWNITTRVKTAVAALAETYRHNAFAAHIGRIAELDKEYSALSATTLEAQIATRVYNQENANSLTTEEKQLQVTRELRNERTKFAQETLQNAQASVTAARRAVEDLDIKNPGAALQKSFSRADADRRLIDPSWKPSLELIKTRAQEVAATLQKWSIEGFRETLSGVRDLMGDTELSARKVTGFLQGLQDKIAIGGAPASAMPGGGILAQLFGKAGTVEAKNQIAEITKSIEEMAASADSAMQEFSNRNMTPAQKAFDAADDFRAQLGVAVGFMKNRGVDVTQFADVFEYLETKLRAATNATVDLDNAQRTADYQKMMDGVTGGMERENRLGSFLDPAKRALEEWKISLRDGGMTDADIEGLLPAKRIQMRADEAHGYITQFLSSTQSTLSSAFESIFTDGPGKFFDNLLSGLQQTLQQMAAQILASFVTSWITRLVGGALGGAIGGGGSFGGGGAMALPGFATGLPRVPFDDYAVRVHKDEAILTAREANNWRAQQRENAKYGAPTRAGAGAGSTPSGNTTIINQSYSVGTVVANNPQEFQKRLPGNQMARGEMQRALAIGAQRGARNL